MQLTLNQALLARALSIVGRAVGTSPSQPLAGYLHLAPTATDLTLTTTDLRTVIRFTLPVQAVADPADLTLPAALLTDFVERCAGDTVTISTDPAHPGAAGLLGGSSAATVRTLDPASFPVVPAVPGTAVLTLPVAALAEAIPTVSFAASRDPNRPALSMVLLEAGAADLHLVGCDGFRLALRRLALPTPRPTDAPPLRLLVPPPALDSLAAILHAAPFAGATPAAAEVTISVSPNTSFVLFSAGPLRLFSRLGDGNYPDWRKPIPAAYHTRATLAAPALGGAVRLAASFVDDAKHQTVTLTPQPADAEQAAGLLVAGESGERGALQSLLAAQIDTASGHDAAAHLVHLHAPYMQQALNAVGGQVTLDLHGPGGPAVVRPAGDDRCLQLILPLARPAAA